MDSLTQITLGAAVGEAVLGRRIGNRAMVWGAIGGTIPDLDVLASFFMDPIPALAFHRGITHSLFFSITLPFLLAFLVHRLYHTRTHQTTGYKIFVSTFCLLLLGGISTGMFFLFGKSVPAGLLIAAASLYLIWRLYHYYLSRPMGEVTVSYRQWYLLFFLALSTHFLLDCFTGFGTQVFDPFFNDRIAFNTIAIIDPLYTVPFLLCIVVASNVRRTQTWRTRVNYLGIMLSSMYLLSTVANKAHVRHVFEKALAYRHLEVDRLRVSPVIFSNFLWSCVAETDSVFYIGQYSNFDTNPNLHVLNTLPKREALAADIAALREYQILQWFSEGYLMHTRTDTGLVISDVRFGGTKEVISSFRDLVFNFRAFPGADGRYAFSQMRERPKDAGRALQELWTRIQGY